MCQEETIPQKARVVTHVGLEPGHEKSKGKTVEEELCQQLGPVTAIGMNARSYPQGGIQAATLVPHFKDFPWRRCGQRQLVNTKMGSQTDPANLWPRPQGKVSRG